MDIHLQKELHDLLVSSLDGSITDTQTKRLNEIMDNDVQARRYCIDFYFLATSMKRPELYIGNNSSDASSESQQQFKDLQEFARYEIAAEIIKAPQPVPSEVVIEDVKPKQANRKINKPSLVTTLILAAAMILLFVWARFTPISADKEVATLSDSLNAEWSSPDRKMEGEKRLSEGFKGSLTKGFTKLLFDNHASVVIEAPADFQIVSGNQITLRRGRLYATVPQKAIGFTVTTRNSRIIDLGTEFGVEANFDDTTELHVLRGKTTLVSGDKNETSLLVTAGQAKRISGLTAVISDISANSKKFVHDINSSNQLIWRGGNLELASLIAGGNGFNAPVSNRGLDPGNGNFTTTILEKNRYITTGYVPVPESPFIDGVFVPNGPAVITSRGHLFQCPKTRGIFTHEIAAFYEFPDTTITTAEPPVFNGIQYGTKEAPALLLHSNIGITFNLQTIRKILPNTRIKSFKAWGGLAEITDFKDSRPDIDFWVLVDGQKKYEKINLKMEDGAITFEIDLNDQDQFLTLIVTDGLREGETRKAAANDFFYLIGPQLCIEPGMKQ
jgi:hypothetical protein